uniref:Retrotransposon gag domain-containing protein n=1 Tax=Tanacetum cinerariifolium TaxID=118510 RepID=A0A6L2MDG0_TANCI|nr:hypothetical protein [Tanacetum cinerariifolium]
MRTRSSANPVGGSSPNLTTSNPKRRNRRRSKKPFILEESPVDTMADQRNMTKLLHAATEGYAEAIVVLLILAEHFELKHNLINMMTSEQFFRLEKDNPHDHIRAAHRWLKKEPSRSILTWEDLVSKFINEFFPPSRTTNLRNEISNFQQRFDESFHEAWGRHKDLLCACPHHDFTILHQLDTFYNALNPNDQDSFHSASGGNLLERHTQDVLMIIKNKSKQTSAVTTAMITILKQFQASPPPASVKSVEEICVTCGGAHPYYQCLAADGNIFPEFQDNIQGYVSAAAINYNQGYNQGNNFNQDSSYQAPIQQNQVLPLSELEKIKKMNEINIKSMQTQINNVKNELRNEMKTSIQASMSNQTNEFKNMLASFFQMNITSTSGSVPLPSNTIANPKGELKAITPRNGLVLDGPSVAMTPPFINPEEDERLEETLTDPELAVILKKLPEKLGDPGTFLIPYSFSELKCKALADLEIEYLLNHDPTKEMDSILKDSVDEDNVADPNVNLFDTIPEMFTDEHTLDYSSLPIYDDFDDDIFKLEFDNKYVYDDPFDSKEDKIKESNFLIDELDLPISSDFLHSLEYDSFLFEDFSKVDALPLTDNEDKVFNLGILIQENLSEVTMRATPDKNVKKIAISYAFLILEDFNPPLYELFSTKKFPGLKLYSRFHPKMRKKFSNPRFSLLKEFILFFSQNYLIGALKLSKSSKFLKAR